MLRNLGVRVLERLLVFGIQQEPSLESRPCGLRLLQGLLLMSALEQGPLVIGHMHCKSVDNVGFIVQWEFEKSPGRLRGTDVASVDIPLYLIEFNVHACPIMTLVGVFVEVLHTPDRAAKFDIDMAV